MRPLHLPALLLVLLSASAARADLPSPAEIAELQSRLARAREAIEDPKRPLSPSDRAVLSVKLGDAERYFQEFLTLSHLRPEEENTSKALAVVGSTVIADDTTGVGAGDDVLLPFIVLGLAVSHLHQSHEERPIAYRWNLALLQLQLFAAALTQVAAAQKKPGCACKCLKQDAGPLPVDRMPNPRACSNYCRDKKGYPGSQCGGVVTWTN